MAENTFILEVITPEEILLREEVQFVVVPETQGELGVLKNHAPMIAALNIGVLRYTDAAGEVKKVAISGGFMEVIYNEARVLAETAEKGSEIDVLRAQEALKRAKRRLEQRDESIDFARAQKALQRAIARLKAADAYNE
ncbi:ATP synthase F1 subcomplex epsilon subunit [Thermosyntropha lipolytica DSM 11003]|uniref:ATP synthase epsilon chain n=1 Tax=Thermosyntropha lipolytica DSM 11003 TaxID=1123382 RepID=A0A1M5NUM8_9FIRM|nr:F0F1 ATP synthase subunit epsilon [Thermosyntropha lipolytica]SHG92889.1 ATP synthase F1 subcomplex epsilon subunit [Thermosyntropha lipolytica DSM 11003]